MEHDERNVNNAQQNGTWQKKFHNYTQQNGTWHKKIHNAQQNAEIETILQQSNYKCTKLWDDWHGN